MVRTISGCSAALKLSQRARTWLRPAWICSPLITLGQQQWRILATRTREGDPEAALVGITATDRGDLVFDTSRRSRKYANLQADQRVAVVIGWDDELTVQIEGKADEPSGDDRQRCLEAYLRSTRMDVIAPRILTSRMSASR